MADRAARSVERRDTEARVTALIVTYRRKVQLRALLGSLREARDPRIERVVIVDDSPEPDPIEKEFPELPLRYVHSAERRFISASKNHGLSLVPTEYVWFVDDDNRLGPNALHPLDVLGRDRTVSAVMPSVLYLRRPELVWVYATPFRPGRWEFELIGRNAPRDPQLEGRLLPTDALPNSSFARTDAVRSVGGFDERLVVDSSSSLCQRLKVAGGAVWADSSAFLLHDVALPSPNGTWAEHSLSDPERTYYEIRDWFRYRRSLHRGESLVRVRALARASRFLVPLAVGAVVGPSSGARGSVLRGLVRGTLAGVREPPLES